MIRPYPYKKQATAPAQKAKLCDAPDCAGEGQHRAPKSPSNLYDYYWFCLDHIKEYNKAWNYCRGMTAQELENMIRTSVVGDRPTWPLGMNSSNAKTDKFWRVKENLARDHVYEEFLKSGGRVRGHAGGEAKKKKELNTPRAEALHALGLGLDADHAAIRKRYRELVKQYHPDADLSDPTRNDKIQKINQAYAVLKALHQTQDN